MNLENILRAAAIGCIMIAGSCAVSNDATTISSDGAVNHPIAVEPTFREIKVQFAGGPQGVNLIFNTAAILLNQLMKSAQTNSNTNSASPAANK